MKEEKHKIGMEVEIAVTDDGKDDYAPGPFFRLPWGWACIVSTILFILDVEYGKKIFGILLHDDVAVVLLWTMFVTYVCFILKLVDRHGKEGGGSSVGCDYPYFGF